ncbi:AbrB family transcriptional regulator, partial [Fischerella thermalis CCMEE 5328]
LNWLPFIDDISFTPPLVIKLLGQMLLGITIGEYWGEKPTFQKRTIGYAIISVAMTLAAGVAATLLAMQLTSWDWLTCLLVTAPGGSAEIILVALTLDHNVEIVTAGHVVRLIAINSFLPIGIFLFRYFDNQEGRRESV